VSVSLKPQTPKYVRTPFGLAWSECLHQVENGVHIIEELGKRTKIVHTDGTVQELPKCSQPAIRNRIDRSDRTRHVRDSPDDGWQVWAAYNNVDNATFDRFLGNFNVPQDPPSWDGNGILYMFTGLQNDNWVPIPDEYDTPPGFDIIQPVLQYGYTPAGGGNFWELASWYVTLDDSYVYSNPIQVNAGTTIFGNMTRITGSTWFLGGTVTGTTQSSSVIVTYPRLIDQPWAYCTLEVYGIQDCAGDFPSSSLTFTDLALYDEGGKQPVVPSWQALDNGADHCGATAKVISPTNVVIAF